MRVCALSLNLVSYGHASIWQATTATASVGHAVLSTLCWVICTARTDAACVPALKSSPEKVKRTFSYRLNF